MTSPTKGAHLLSAIGDYGGFVHWDLDKPAPEGASSPPVFNNSSGIAYRREQARGDCARWGILLRTTTSRLNISYSAR